MRIALSEHFTYKKLLRFVLPSVVMMIFTSVYGIVDGFFISNYVGKAPFAAVNLIIPYSMIFGSFGFMIGAGGSALVSHRLGEQRQEKANELFSLLVYVTIGAGIAFSAIGALTTREVAVLFQADEEMLPYCVQYGVILMIGLPGFMLQNVFQSFFITAEKPKLGLTVTLIAGVTNMALDWLFMAVFSWGVIGAAIATISSQMAGGVIPLFYFA
ncbi:MAG: MATE family efflux transporter, partial [Christensenellaceae bacterium]